MSDQNPPEVTPLPVSRPPSQSAGARSHKPKPWSFWIALTLMLLLLFSMLLNFGLFAIIGASSVTKGPDALHEKWVECDGEAKICLIDMKGVITDQASFLSGSGVIAVDQTT